jgi:hypothetical protein
LIKNNQNAYYTEVTLETGQSYLEKDVLHFKVLKYIIKRQGSTYRKKGNLKLATSINQVFSFYHFFELG